MIAEHEKRLLELLAPISEPKSNESVSEWCARNIIFNEPKLNAPLSFGGREYMREMLDAWGENSVKDLIFCMGTRTGKTRVLMGGAAWRIATSPMRCLWTLPATDGPGGARSFSGTRFQPMIRATPALSKLISKGLHRQFKVLQQVMGGSIIDFIGTGSPKQLGGNPCDVTVQDEVDGQILKGESEAHPSILIDQRTKEFSNPKRVKTSTPTLETGVIWQELLKTDLRRRYVPCPHCQKFVILAWSEQYTVLPKTGSEAYVFWDKEAKGKDGSWDFDRVIQSAHARCPFCAGHILDTHKTKIDRQGEWRPTKKGIPGYRGYHLPSMYSVTVETSFGHMAKRFIAFSQGLQGMKGFINNDLAEPDVSQELSINRCERVVLTSEVGDGWVKILSIDCQQKAPYFWYTVRAWSENASEGIVAGSCDTWEEIEQIQANHDVKDSGVIVDSGFGAKSDAEVYRNCAEHGELVKVPGKDLPYIIGWNPAKGMGGNKRYKDEKGLTVPYRMQPIDPYVGTDQAGRVRAELFEFAADFFKDVLTNMRKGVGGNFKWSVPEKMATELYWKHMDGQVKKSRVNKQTNFEVPQWEKRHRHWPDHIFSCEVQSTAYAAFLGVFNLEFKLK